MISTLAHRALERDGLGPIRDKVLARRAAHGRRRAPPPRDGGPRRGGRAREPRARGAPRRPHLLQPQRPPEPDERLRRDLQVLLVRAQGRPGRVRGLHDDPRRGGREGARAPLARDHRGAHRLRAPPGPALRVLPGAPRAGSAQAWPELAIKAFTAIEIHFFAEKFGKSYEQVLQRAARRRHGHDARRRRRDLRDRACAGRSATTRRPPSSGSRSTAPRTGSA